MRADDPTTYVPDFISFGKDVLFDRLYHELDWDKREGAPRWEYWTNVYDRPYTYGRGKGVRTYESRESHVVIDAIRSKLWTDHGVAYEGCFLNAYGTKRDWLGWHQDDDPGIDHSKPIAVVTLGQGRNIQYREVLIPPNEDPAIAVYGEVKTRMLEPGSLFLMGAGMQQHYQHRIPKAAFEAKPRISLTFRALLP